jgi:glyoxylase-like metal-dependent hydrolase (beta-lactamase superfamily II)
MKRASVLKAPYENITTIEEALGRFGFTPAQVETVILTHLHGDHALNIRKFTNAAIYVQEEELAFAKTPHPLFAGTFPAGRFDGIDFKTIKGDYHLAEGVELLLTPGHTVGSQSVAVATAGGKAIICGACSLPESFTGASALTEVTAPGIHIDPIQGYESLVRIKREADIIIPLHDSAHMKEAVIG